jgi:hypothetical protein
LKTRILLHLDSDKIGPEIIQHLRDLYPGISNAYRFAGKALDAADPRSQQVLDYLAEQGWFPNPGTREQRPNEFGMTMDRIYDVQDLEEAEYLTMSVNPGVSENTAQVVAGKVCFLKPVAKAKNIASVAIGGMVDSGRIKTVLEREALHHISFLPTEVVTKTGERLGETPYWQMVTDLSLPPVSPSMKKVNSASGVPMEEDEPGDFYMREGLTIPQVLYCPSETHYLASDLRSVAPFDLALAREKEGLGADFQCKIASQRLYQVLTGLGLDILWRPVRLEED